MGYEDDPKALLAELHTREAGWIKKRQLVHESWILQGSCEVTTGLRKGFSRSTANGSRQEGESTTLEEEAELVESQEHWYVPKEERADMELELENVPVEGPAANKQELQEACEVEGGLIEKSTEE